MKREGRGKKWRNLILVLSRCLTSFMNNPYFSLGTTSGPYQTGLMGNCALRLSRRTVGRCRRRCPKKLERTHVMSRNGFSLPRSFRGMGGRTSVSGFTSLFSLTQPNKHFLPPLLPLSFRGGVEVRANAVTVPNFYFFLTIVISPASGRHTVLLCSGFWLLLSPPRPSADLRLPKARSRIGTPLLLSFSLGGVARSSGCPSLPSLALLFAVAASNSVPPSLPRAATTHATGRRRGGRTW